MRLHIEAPIAVICLVVLSGVGSNALAQGESRVTRRAVIEVGLLAGAQWQNCGRCAGTLSNPLLGPVISAAIEFPVSDRLHARTGGAYWLQVSPVVFDGSVSYRAKIGFVGACAVDTHDNPTFCSDVGYGVHSAGSEVAARGWFADAELGAPLTHGRAWARAILRVRKWVSGTYSPIGLSPQPSATYRPLMLEGGLTLRSP
jgi:hypothetical protein